MMTRTAMRAAMMAAALAMTAGCQRAADPDAASVNETMPANAATDKAAMADMTEAQRAYAEVNKRMHMGMENIPADADEAFMRGMLSHHRGAVEMSEVALKYGKDAKVRDLAQRIIRAQQAEMDEMEAWLKARGAAAPAAPAAGTKGMSAADHAAMGH